MSKSPPPTFDKEDKGEHTPDGSAAKGGSHDQASQGGIHNNGLMTQTVQVSGDCNIGGENNSAQDNSKGREPTGSRWSPQGDMITLMQESCKLRADVDHNSANSVALHSRIRGIEEKAHEAAANHNNLVRRMSGVWRISMPQTSRQWPQLSRIWES